MTSPVPDALRTQLAEALPHEPWCHHDMDCCGCTCLDDRLLAVGPLLPVVEQHTAAARAEGAAEALREAAEELNTPDQAIEIALSGADHIYDHLRTKAAALSAPTTTEGDPT